MLLCDTSVCLCTFTSAFAHAHASTLVRTRMRVIMRLVFICYWNYTTRQTVVSVGGLGLSELQIGILTASAAVTLVPLMLFTIPKVP